MQVPATVGVVIAADDTFVAEPDDGAGLGVATAAAELPGPVVALGVGLAAASGAGMEVGAAAQVFARVVDGTGFGVGATLPIGAAVPPVVTAVLVEGAAEAGVWLRVVIGAWLGFTGVDRPGGVILLWLGVTGAGVGVALGVGVGVLVWASRTPTPATRRIAVMIHAVRI